MWRRIFFAAVLLLESSPSLRAAEPHVVLITIDGFPAAMFRDPKTPIPNLRALAAEGVSAEGMHVSNPTITWPNHTTLLTGTRAAKHGVLYNGIVKRGAPDQPLTINSEVTKAELVAIPTLFDAVHRAGQRTAAIDWPCTRSSDSLDDDLPDSPEPLQHTTPRLLKELVAAGILPSDNEASFHALTGPDRDEIWTRAACHVLATRKPHFLALHLLNTDGIHHRYGPDSPASYTALALADSYVGRVLQTLSGAGLRSNTTVFVLADHGFARATNILQPNVVLRQAGLLQLGSSNQIVRARVQVIPEGGTGMVYLNNPQTREADRRKVLELFTNREGVAQIVEPAQFAALGFPDPEPSNGMPDLVLAAREGYAISGTATGEEFVVHAGLENNLGYHGYLATNPRMDAPLIVAGPSIRRGAKLGVVENIDIAPTIAHILNVTLPADGKVLNEIFTTR